MADQYHSHRVKDCLTFHSQGGLGNQIFILAAGLAHADRLGTNLRLDISAHELKGRPPFHLGAAVSALNSGSNTRIQIAKCRVGGSGLWRRLEIPRRCTFSEASPGYNPASLGIKTGECLSGYFQSWKYLEMLTPERMTAFRSAVKSLLPDESQTMAPEDIVVHVRRGDYLKPKNQGFHGVLGLSYYSDAIERLRLEGQTGRVWIVSEESLDDIQVWRTQIGDVVELPFADLWSDLVILKHAPSLVVANSSFSWMGAWLGHQERVVVAPDPWFANPRMVPNELIPPNWICVAHEFDGNGGGRGEDFNSSRYQDEGSVR